MVAEEAQELVMSKMAQVLWDASDSFCEEYGNELQNAQDVPEVKFDGTHCHKEGNAAAARRRGPLCCKRAAVQTAQYAREQHRVCAATKCKQACAGTVVRQSVSKAPNSTTHVCMRMHMCFAL